MTDNLMGRAYSTYCRDRFVPERNINLMPVNFRNRLCTCIGRTGYVTKKRDDHGSIISVCDACGKPESYYMFRCASCENLFIHDFRAYFCYKQPICWTCINENPVQCSNHNYCQPFWSPENWVAPVLPEPRVFTKEELADVFDF